MENDPIKNDERALNIPKGFVERRKKHPTKDALYVCVNLLNVGAWVLLVAALLVFHYARPEFITGVQDFWGIEGRNFWSEEHLEDLLGLLQFCLIVTLITMFLRTKRSRRRSDNFGYNLIILLVISVLSLATLYSTV